MILILRALGLGDLLTGVPALRAIRRAYPDEEIVLATPGALEPIVARIRAVDRVLPVATPAKLPPDSLARIGERPRLAVNLHGRGPQSTKALLGVGAEALWAFGEPGAPTWREREHEVARWCRFVGEFGCLADPADLGLTRRGSRGLDTAVIHPGSTDDARRWPAERFAEVARHLTGRGLRVSITAGPAERGLAAETATLAGLGPEAVAADLDVGQLADLIGRAALVVCGDTGVAHLATACRTPSVVLFGPQPPTRSGPPPDPRHRALWFGPERRAATAGPHPALLRIRPLDVITAAENILTAVLPRLVGGSTAAATA